MQAEQDRLSQMEMIGWFIHVFELDFASSHRQHCQKILCYCDKMNGAKATLLSD